MTDPQRARLQERLADLRNELASGETLRTELTGRIADLDKTMLRIAGAIQVLEELIAEMDTPTD